MTRRIIKIGIPAAAAAALLLVVFLNQVTQPAYALAQTVEASKAIRSIHYVKIDYPRDPAEAPYEAEQWMEFNADGSLSRHRKECTEKQGIVSVWDAGIDRTWVSGTNRFLVAYQPIFGGLVRADEDVNDPRIAAETLASLQTEQKVKIAVDQAAGKDIRLTVTPLVPEKQLPSWWAGDKNIILVDAKTKLWKQRDLYEIRDGQERLWVRWSWLQYNESFDPSLFVLTAPAGAEIDDRTGDTGMAQGSVTDAQAASQIVRQYYQAMMAADYERAAKLSGSTAELLQEWANRCGKLVRIVWLGEPVAKPEWGSRIFEVPYTIELEKADGTRSLIGPKSEHPELGGPLQHRAHIVAPVPGSPERWMTVGG